MGSSILVLALAVAAVVAIVYILTGDGDASYDPTPIPTSQCANGATFIPLGDTETEALNKATSKRCNNFAYENTNATTVGVVKNYDGQWGCCACAIQKDLPAFFGLRCETTATPEACKFYINPNKPENVGFDGTHCVCLNNSCDRTVNFQDGCEYSCFDCSDTAKFKGCIAGAARNAEGKCDFCECKVPGDYFTTEGGGQCKPSGFGDKSCVIEGGDTTVISCKANASNARVKSWTEVSNVYTLSISKDNKLVCNNDLGGRCMTDARWNDSTGQFECWCEGCKVQPGGKAAEPDTSTGGVPIARCCDGAGDVCTKTARPPPSGGRDKCTSKNASESQDAFCKRSTKSGDEPRQPGDCCDDCCYTQNLDCTDPVYCQQEYVACNDDKDTCQVKD